MECLCFSLETENVLVSDRWLLELLIHNMINQSTDHEVSIFDKLDHKFAEPLFQPQPQMSTLQCELTSVCEERFSTQLI